MQVEVVQMSSSICIESQRMGLFWGAVDTSTEKIVVVIVRNEANYRSAHVWPPYAYSLTYSKTY